MPPFFEEWAGRPLCSNRRMDWEGTERGALEGIDEETMVFLSGPSSSVRIHFRKSGMDPDHSGKCQVRVSRENNLSFTLHPWKVGRNGNRQAYKESIDLEVR